MACGTGRISILLAKEGYNIIAFDRSEGILTRFREKLTKEPSGIKQRVQIFDQNLVKDPNLLFQFEKVD